MTRMNAGGARRAASFAAAIWVAALSGAAAQTRDGQPPLIVGDPIFGGRVGATPPPGPAPSSGESAGSPSPRAAEAGPRSVIPWLDQAIGEASRGGPVEGAAAAALDRQADGVIAPVAVDGPESQGGPTAVDVQTLDAVRATAAGVVSADEVGLPVDGWAGVNAADAAQLIDGLTPGAIARANRLAVDLLSVAFEPPTATPASFGVGRDFLRARLDALMRFGAHERAVAVAATAGPERALDARDAALVSGEDEAFCAAALSLASEARPLERVYCLATTGDAAGAMLAIEASRAVGGADPRTLALLEAIAEPALADYVAPPTDYRDLTPLDLAALRRAKIAPPVEFARAAPLTLAPAAAHAAAPPRMRLEALERLEASGALSTGALRAAFDASRSAESGGVWGRVEAYRRATAPGAPLALFEAALARSREGAHFDLMARLLAPSLAQALANGAAGQVGPELKRALWLGREWSAAVALSSGSVEDRALVAIAGQLEGWRPDAADSLFARAARGDERAARLAAALTALGVPTSNPGFYLSADELAFVEGGGRSAETAFSALAGLGGDAPQSGPALFGALSNLVAVGLVEPAREIAIEAVLAE